MNEKVDLSQITEETTYLDKLIELQSKIGYKPGRVNPVALLGLMGEVGEVAQETILITNKDPMAMMSLNLIKQTFEVAAANADRTKKKLRDFPVEGLVVEIVDLVNFRKELADAFYYLVACTTGINMTLEDLARVSYNKVMDRRGQVNEGDETR